MWILATPLSDAEKLAFMRGSIPGCISKNVIAQNITLQEDKKLIESYCSCQASTVASIVTKEEVTQISKGIVPISFPSKVQLAREQCISSIRAQ